MAGLTLRDLIERLGGLLRAEQRIEGIADGLQPVHHDVLRYLARCNRYSNTPAAVTDYLQITKGTASQSIQVLERRGLVHKNPDKDDGRVVRLRLSAGGRRLAARLAHSGSWEHLSDTVGPAKLAAAEKALIEILRRLQHDNEYRSFGQCRTCGHLRRQGRGSFRCGLTGEALESEETLQICREHSAGSAAAVRGG